MDQGVDRQWLEFRPRPSKGQYWVAGIGGSVLLVAAGPFVVLWDEILPVFSIFSIIIGVTVSAPMLLLAWCFPEMRYLLGRDELVLRFGPLMADRIPLHAIDSVRRRDLRNSLLASFRFPDLALFDVPYKGMGVVRMCATSATRDILLIESGTRRYGITPEDPDAFIDALLKRAGPNIRILEDAHTGRAGTGAES